jgi:predicted nuclease with TOPRIM domain
MSDLEARFALETPENAQTASLQELKSDAALRAPSADTAMLLAELRSLKEDIHARLQQVDTRLQRIDGRFQPVEGRLLQIDGRFMQFDGRFLHIKSRFQQADKKVERQFRLTVGILVSAIGAFLTALMGLYVR